MSSCSRFSQAFVNVRMRIGARFAGCCGQMVVSSDIVQQAAMPVALPANVRANRSDAGHYPVSNPCGVALLRLATRVASMRP